MLRPRLWPFAVAAAVFLLPGCDRGPGPESAWRDAGVITRVSAEAEAFLSIQRGTAHAADLAAAWRPLLDDPALRTAWEASPAGHIVDAVLEEKTPQALLATVLDSAEDEVFLVCGPGTAAQLAALQRIKRLFEAARIRNLFTPFPGVGPFAADDGESAETWPADLADAAFTEVIIPLPPVMEEALEIFIRDAAIPPLLAGFRLAPVNGALPDLLRTWVADMPAHIPRDEVATDDGLVFTRARIPLFSIVPLEAAQRARDLLAASIGDPFTATEIIRELLAKTTILQFGEARGYFLISVGMDDPLAALTENFRDSLAATDKLGPLRPHLGPGVVSIFYADPLMVSLAASPPPVGEYLDAAMESALEFAPADRVRALRAAAEPLRAQANELFHPRIAALSGIIKKDGPRWTADLFGGSLAPRLAMENAVPLLASDDELALLWTEQWEQDYIVRLARFTAAATDFADQWLDALGPVFLQPQDRERSTRLLDLAAASSAPLGGEAGALLGTTFNNEVALALGLDGVMPSAPFAPPAAAQALLPRLAVAAGLRDAGDLSRLRQALLARDEGEAWLTPSAGAATDDGGTRYVYPLPLAGPDLGLAIHVQKHRWILGNSPSFNDVVARRPRARRGESAVQTIRAHTAPAAAFAAAWGRAIAADPALGELTFGLMPREPSTLQALAAVLAEPRRFAYRAVWRRDVLHRALVLEPQP